MIKFVTAMAVCAFMVFCWAVPASAVVGLSPTEVQAGTTIDLQLSVTASTKPTSRVELNFVEPNIAQADAAFVDGWSATLDRNSADLVSSVTWDKGEIAVGQTQTFTLTVTVPDSSPRIEMTAIQASADGTIERVPVEGQKFGLNVAGANVTTPQDTVGTTVMVPEAEAESDGRGFGFYLIAFGVVVVLVLYVRTKRRVEKMK